MGGITGDLTPRRGGALLGVWEEPRSAPYIRSNLSKHSGVASGEVTPEVGFLVALLVGVFAAESAVHLPHVFRQLSAKPS